jgi:hypothetical protein
VEQVVLENRRHGTSKLSEDRRRYRRAWQQVRAKHAGLYARRAQLAAESSTGAAGRLVYRFFWGPRPLPAAVEGALHRALWAR